MEYRLPLENVASREVFFKPNGGVLVISSVRPGDRSTSNNASSSTSEDGAFVIDSSRGNVHDLPQELNTVSNSTLRSLANIRSGILEYDTLVHNMQTLSIAERPEPEAPLNAKMQTANLLKLLDTTAESISGVASPDSDTTAATSMLSDLRELDIQLKILSISICGFTSQDTADSKTFEASLRQVALLLLVWKWNSQLLRIDPTSSSIAAEGGDHSIPLPIESNPEIVEPEPKAQSPLCLLEMSMLRSRNIPTPLKAGFYPVGHFTQWATEETSTSAINQEVGVVRSVHLLRERQAPLHHEYALICFGLRDTAESWVRVERAARVKTHWHRLQRDSFGPIFGGAPLRETISFALSKDALIRTESDELITVSHDHMLESPATTMSLHELGFHLGNITSAAPKYSLLTYNCRWFARRVVLGFLERAKSVTPHEFSVQWRGQPSTYKHIHKAIQRDPFGGLIQENKHGVWIQAANLNQLARHQYDAGRYLVALETCSRALPNLQTAAEAASDADFYRHHLGQCFHTLSAVLSSLDRHQEAFEAIQKACDIMRTAGATSFDSHQSAYASALSQRAVALFDLGRLHEAISVSREVLSLRRKVIGLEPKSRDAHYLLSRALHNLNVYLMNAGNLEESLALTSESLKLVRLIYKVRQDLYRETLAETLSARAAVLSQMKHYDDALPVYKESVELLREFAEANPNVWKSKLAEELDLQAVNASHVRMWVLAAEAAQEATHIRQALFDKDPDPNRAKLALTLFNYGTYAVEAGSPKIALWIMRRSSVALFELAKGDPEQWEPWLLRLLNNMENTFTMVGYPGDAERCRVMIAKIEEAQLRRSKAIKDDKTLS